jgi:hypothetical protein
MLTYLEGLPPNRRLQRSESILGITIHGAAPLAIELPGRFPPCQIVYHGELCSPKDGRGMWNGEDDAAYKTG